MDNKILKILQCPDCAGALHEAENGLVCSVCRRKYEIKNGIIYLYPEKVDSRHLQEEIGLAAEMKTEDETDKEKLSAAQWNLSKKEFWDIVRKESGSSSAGIANIGCGFDDNFRYFQDRGDLFINFDLVPEMLENLKGKGAEFCVAGDLHSLPFQENSLDNLICIDVIHHESENLPAIAEAFHKILKPGGKLFLEDVNAWGLFQFYKSILLPRAWHRLARMIFHKIKKTTHQPADYEFPTNPFAMKKLLEKIGFSEIKFWPLRAYPNRGRLPLLVYNFLRVPFHLEKFHNFHYLLTARKKNN